MKEIGVIRRIDDLGRVVIPKEIRRNFHIIEGDSLEVFVDKDSIILKKYSLLDNILENSLILVDIFYKIYKKNILITNKEKVISVSKNKIEYLNKDLTSNIKEKINERCEFTSTNKSLIIQDGKVVSYFLVPILVNSDSIGSVIIFDEDIIDKDRDISRFIAQILVKLVAE